MLGLYRIGDIGWCEDNELLGMFYCRDFRSIEDRKKWNVESLINVSLSQCLMSTGRCASSISNHNQLWGGRSKGEGGIWMGVFCSKFPGGGTQDFFLVGMCRWEMKSDPYIYQILTQNWTHIFTKNPKFSPDFALENFAKIGFWKKWRHSDLPKWRFEKGSFIYQRGENGTLFRCTSPIPLVTRSNYWARVGGRGYGWEFPCFKEAHLGKRVIDLVG